MKVLSLFDGIACGYEALKRAGIPIDAYYASEIDKYAIQIAKKNHPDIIEIGDVCRIGYNTDELGEGGMLYRLEEDGGIYLIDRCDIDLLIGGSPCQGFSVAGKQLNFNDPRSKLFFEYVRILKECKPKYFLLENVRMKKEFQDIISKELGVEPIMINSSLVSGQNRARLYWTNIPGITQPDDKGILLKDILEENVDEKYYYSKERWDRVQKGKYDIVKRLENVEGKCNTLTTVGGGNHERKIKEIVTYTEGELRIKQATKQGYIVAEEGDGIDLSFPNSQNRRGRVIKGKSNTLTTTGDKYVYEKKITIPCGTQLGNSKQFGNSYGSQKAYTLRACNPNGVIEQIGIRKLTPVECERLQTLPDNYTAGVSDSQRYKQLGNGWTVDVISHILSFIK